MRELRELISQDVTVTAVRVRTVVFAVLALWALPVLLALVYGAFSKHEIHLSHDEAEHLHVVFALQRGEVPYRDFIENHPVLPHVLLSGLSRGLGRADSADVYWLAKVAVLAHFLGCLLLLFSWLNKYRQELGLQLSPLVTFPLVAALLGVWRNSGELAYRFNSLWEVRPDWVCHFWTLTALLLAVEALRRSSSPRAVWLSLGAGACAGLATALMPKSVLILLPAALTLLLTAVRWVRVHPDGARRLLRPAALAGCFVLAAAVMFVAGVAGELAATGATPGEYWSANVALNAKKHLVQMTDDLAPANVLRGLSGLSFVAAIAMTTLGFALTGHAKRKESWLRYGVFTFAGIQLLFSISLPAFSNGLSWPQYFMPALLALLLVFVLVLDTLAAALFSAVLLPSRPLSRTTGLALRWMPALWLVAVLAGVLLDRTIDVRLRWDDMHAYDQQSQALYGDGVLRGLPDVVLPSDLSYLTFMPQRKPLQARAWGYYFMLVSDRHIWPDTYALGLGPDPRTHWRTLYARQPPDAILVRDASELREQIRMARRMQDIDIAWLDDAVRRDYTCLTRTGVSLQVRHALVDRFTGHGFKPCRPNKEKPEWL